MTVKYIDPPSGWMYGFPKEFPEVETDLYKWLVDNGYPQEEIEKWEGDMPIRIIYKGDDWS